MTGDGGLRARRREQTSGDIRDAAIELVRSRGFTGVTVADICTRAGVSQRTFFNYFASKELAIASGPPALPADLAKAFVYAGPAPQSVVFADLIGLIGTRMAGAPGREHTAAMLEIARTTPVVQSAMLGSFERLERELTGLVAQRCGMSPDDDVPLLIAAVALTTIRTGMTRWASAPPAEPDDSPLPYLQRAAETVTAIFTV